MGDYQVICINKLDCSSKYEYIMYIGNMVNNWWMI